MSSSTVYWHIWWEVYNESNPHIAIHLPSWDLVNVHSSVQGVEAAAHEEQSITF